MSRNRRIGTVRIALRLGGSVALLVLVSIPAGGAQAAPEPDTEARADGDNAGGAIPPPEQEPEAKPDDGKGSACSCQNDTGICVRYTSKGVSKNACVYLVNVFGPELADLQDKMSSEKEFIAAVRRKGSPESPNWCRFFQTTSDKSTESRISQDGIVMVRAFSQSGTRGPLNLQEISGLELKVGAMLSSLKPNGGTGQIATVSLAETLGKAQLGDAIALEVSSDESKPTVRYAWFRPRTGWVIDYEIAGFALAWPSWRFKGDPEVAVIPAALDVEYRYYQSKGSYYLFGTASIGLNFKLSDAKQDGADKSGDSFLKGVNGMIAAVSLNLNGLRIGFGTRWVFSESRLDPMIVLSLTEAVARGLGITGQIPSKIAGADN
jgi:hypothetical protein